MEQIRWVFTHGYAGNWHPLTWISHMLDCQFWGLNPAGHHLTSLLLHISNSMLLFLVLMRMTGERWRSALVAALFAWHPLHVESVAWVSERKDVLSGFFFLVTVMAYIQYESKVSSRKSKIGEGEQSKMHTPAFAESKVVWWYAATVVCYGLGLMAKPMLVTLPFVLLLLDYWPLGRFAADRKKAWMDFGWLVLEKVPLFLLAGISSAVTFLIQQRVGALWSLEQVPLSLRLENSLVSYAAYIVKMFWPVNLAVFYPYRVAGNEWELVGAFLVIGAITAGVITVGRADAEPIENRRYSRLKVGATGFRFLMPGWFWYLGMLVPVIGLVQTGGQAMADRYTYLPMIGLFIMLAWLIPEPSTAAAPGKWHPRLIAVGICGAGALLGCLVLTYRQVGYWVDNKALFQRALAATGPNAFAHVNLAESLRDEGDLQGAARELGAALAINPRYREARHNLGSVLLLQGNEAEAIRQFEEALRLYPDYASAHNNLGEALMRQGNTEQAIVHWETALKLEPELPEALNNLAWVKATAAEARYRDGKEAVRLASRAAELSARKNPSVLDTLAAAFAESGDFEQAITTAGEAYALAMKLNQQKVAPAIAEHLTLFRAKMPVRSQ